MEIINMKLIDLKNIIKDTDTGIIKVKDSITGEYYMVDDIVLDCHGDLVIKVV